jgi:hypothetical protein
VPQFRLDAASYFDPFAGEESWLKSHVSVIKAYPPFGDRYVKSGLPVIGYHDPATEGFAPLEPSQVTAYVAEVDRDVSAGYAGVFVDDANWSFSPSPGPAEHLANLMDAIRAAEPHALIEMNSQYGDISARMTDPSVERALRDVNLVTKEFGVGPTAGINSGPAYAAFLSWVDTLHSKGIHVVLTGDRNANNDSFREYNLATYFLFNDGHDFINGTQQTPTNFWPGFTVNLGEATSPRVRSPEGVWTRSFSNGVVFSVEPGAPTHTIVLPAPMKTVSGETVSSITVAAAHGAVLHN